jgi:hypothetical protein
MTLVTLILGTASGLSMFYWFGVIRTVPYPGGRFAPMWSDFVVMDGGLGYSAGQGMRHARPNSPYGLIGTHWRWRRNDNVGVGSLWSRPILRGNSGEIWMPAWLIVGPPLAAALALWMPVILARRRRRPGECECGYDLRGTPSAVCPECGRGGDGSNRAPTSA